MRYKTLFRLALKVIGVFLMLHGVANLVASIAAAAYFWRTDSYLWVWMLSSVFHVLIGVYLFFDGRWVTDLAIPSNRPYCPECAYELRATLSDRCPECGTPIPTEIHTPQPAPPPES